MKYNVSKGHAYSTHLTTWRRLPTCSQNVAIHIGSDYIMRRTILLCFEKIPSLLSNQSQKMSKCDKITTHWGRMNKVKKHEKQKSLTNLYQCFLCYLPIILSEVLNRPGCSFTVLSNLSTNSASWIFSFHMGPPMWNCLPHWSHEDPTGGPMAGGYFLLRPSSIQRPTSKDDKICVQ